VKTAPFDGPNINGAPGSNVVPESDYARLYLSGTEVQGSRPPGPSVQITWTVAFKGPAKGNYKQFLKITDDTVRARVSITSVAWKVKP